jgi:hypothetical protein
MTHHQLNTSRHLPARQWINPHGTTQLYNQTHRCSNSQFALQTLHLHKYDEFSDYITLQSLIKLQDLIVKDGTSLLQRLCLLHSSPFNSRASQQTIRTEGASHCVMCADKDEAWICQPYKVL